MNIVHAEGLTVEYGTAPVLSDVSFSIHQGDYVGLVGPNGSGKSTLIKCMLGLVRPRKGTVTLFGKDPSEMLFREKTGFLPQKMALFNPRFPTTVREVVSQGLIPLCRSGRNSRDEMIGRALALLDIESIGSRLIGELSGGQQQRAFIARALVNEPDLLILDEPATALDPESRDGFYAMLHNLNRERNVTILLVTHDIGGIGAQASKMLYLDKKVIFFGGFDDFCMSESMAQFFGSSSQHIICHKHD